MTEKRKKDIDLVFQRVNRRLTDLQKGVRAHVQIERHSATHSSGRVVREDRRTKRQTAAA